MTDADFRARRLTGVGGSDAPAALGISPWRTPYDLWVEKTGQGSPVAETEPMTWGTLLEPVIRTEYIRRTGRAVEVPSEMLRHPVHTWMIAHLDGRAPDRDVEIKTARTSEGWGEPGSDEIPMAYLVQVHHCLIVSGAELADLAVLIGGSDFRIYEIHADPIIAERIIGREAEFWQRVEQHVPPDPVNLDDARARWGRILIEGAVRAGEGEFRAIQTLRWVREQRATIDAAEAEAKLAVMQALSDRGDTLVDANGTRLATWALARDSKIFDAKSFANDHPALFDEYRMTRPGARRFLLKG